MFFFIFNFSSLLSFYFSFFLPSFFIFFLFVFSFHFFFFFHFSDSKKKDCLYIYQSQINPPIYKLVTGEVTYELPEVKLNFPSHSITFQILNYVFAFPQGRNNMFQVILLFLHHTQKYHAGMLGLVFKNILSINATCRARKPGDIFSVVVSAGD